MLKSRAFLGLFLEDRGFVPVAIQTDLVDLDATATQPVPRESKDVEGVETYQKGHEMYRNASKCWSGWPGCPASIQKTFNGFYRNVTCSHTHGNACGAASPVAALLIVMDRHFCLRRSMETWMTMMTPCHDTIEVGGEQYGSTTWQGYIDRR